MVYLKVLTTLMMCMFDPRYSYQQKLKRPPMSSGKSGCIHLRMISYSRWAVLSAMAAPYKQWLILSFFINHLDIILYLSPESSLWIRQLMICAERPTPPKAGINHI